MRPKFIILSALFVVLFSSRTSLGQDQKPDSVSVGPPTVTAAATGEQVRFAAPANVTQLRLEVYSETGQKVFDSDVREGNVLDWLVLDRSGNQLTDGDYLCVVTTRSLSGRTGQRLAIAFVRARHAEMHPAESKDVNAMQQQVLSSSESLASITVMQPGEVKAATSLAHDGNQGELIRTTGALSFRLGDYFSGQDTEQMRLTEHGNLGIGTAKPKFKLDVAGAIRARGGIVFDDGSALTSTGRAGTVNKSGETVPYAAGTGTLNFLAKWTETGGAGTLGDSGVFQAANGNIGIGTPNPGHPFVVRKNGGNIGVHNVGELFVDRDNNSRSASLTVGTAGVLKWIFGMPSGGDGFQIYDLLNNVSRFFVDPTSGNVGIGSTGPTSKLHVVGSAAVSGSNAASVLTVIGGKGGDAPGPSVRGGNGASVFIQAGDGGNADGASAGEGGTVSIKAGTSGFASSSTNHGGSIDLRAGDGQGGTFGFAGSILLEPGLSLDAGLPYLQGNVGIGTGVWTVQNPPRYKLHIIDSSYMSFRVQSNVAGGTVASFGGNGNFEIDKPGIVGGRFVVKEDGKVGIGTASPVGNLHLNVPSSANPINALTLDVESFSTPGNAVASYFFKVRDIFSGSPPAFLIRGDGRVGIGFDAPAHKLDVNGDVGATGYFSTSDGRYKKNIAPLNGALDKVMRLRGVTFDWRQEEFPALNFSKDKQVGFIAQEVKSVLPEAVNKDANGYYQVAYTEVIPVLVEAVKQQQKEIEQLRSELQRLRVTRRLKSQRRSIIH